MQEFIDLVRSGRIKGPQQIGFTLESWNNAYNGITDPDDIDQNLYSAGVWFHQEFTHIREVNKRLTEEASVADPKRFFIGIATREWMALVTRLDKSLEDYLGSTMFAGELAQAEITTIFGTKVTPDGVIETLVDGIRFPLSTVKPCSNSQKSSVPDLTLAAAAKLFVTAQLYHILEQLWLELTWNDYCFQQSESTVVITPPDDAAHRAKAISQFRRQALLVETVDTAISIWKHQLPSHIKQIGLRDRKLFTIIRKPSGKLRIKVSEASQHTESPHAAPIQHILTHPYTDEYVKRSFPQLCNLTLKTILLAFDLLAQIPRQMIRFLPYNTVISTIEGAISCTPEFEKEELHNAFRKALSISDSQAEFLIQRMTHGGSVRDQLWFKPIVDLGNRKISLFLPAIDGIHVYRLFDSLIKDVPNAETEMGELFENYVRESMVKASREYKFAPDLRVYGKRLQFRSRNGGFEEVDLAFAVGNHIFIAECKASLYPTEPLETYRYLQKLKAEAVSQATRKVEFIRKNIVEFLDKVSFPLNPNEAEVSPLVVTNGNLYCGYPVGHVPLCDVLILSRYFREGRLEKLVERDQDGKTLPTEVEHFYQSRAQAIQNFGQYVLHPPQVKVYESYLELQQRPLPTFAQGTTASFKEYSVRMDYEALKSKVAGFRESTTNQPPVN